MFESAEISVNPAPSKCTTGLCTPASNFIVKSPLSGILHEICVLLATVTGEQRFPANVILRLSGVSGGSADLL